MQKSSQTLLLHLGMLSVLAVLIAYNSCSKHVFTSFKLTYVLDFASQKTFCFALLNCLVSLFKITSNNAVRTLRKVHYFIVCSVQKSVKPKRLDGRHSSVKTNVVHSQYVSCLLQAVTFFCPPINGLFVDAVHHPNHTMPLSYEPITDAQEVCITGQLYVPLLQWKQRKMLHRTAPTPTLFEVNTGNTAVKDYKCVVISVKSPPALLLKIFTIHKSWGGRSHSYFTRTKRAHQQ